MVHFTVRAVLVAAGAAVLTLSACAANPTVGSSTTQPDATPVGTAARATIAVSCGEFNAISTVEGAYAAMGSVTGSTYTDANDHSLLQGAQNACIVDPSRTLNEIMTELAGGQVAAAPSGGTADILTAPDACEVVPLATVAKAAGVSDYGVPTRVLDGQFQSGVGAFGDFVDTTYCDLRFGTEARAALGIDNASRADESDLVIGVSAYNASAFTASGTPWSDADPISLLSSYYGAHSEKIGTNGVASFVGDTMIQDDATVIAVINDEFWLEVTFYMCHAKDCGPASLAVAQAIVPLIAAAS